MKVKIRTVLAAVAVVLGSASAHAQDMIASKAKADKRLAIVDSIDLRRINVFDGNRGGSSNSSFFNVVDNPNYKPGKELYPEWNNKRGRNYGVEKPKEYKIDLSHFHMPCDSRVVTSHFGYRPAFGRNHYGTDIKVYVGDTIRSAFNGKIRIVAYEAKGYGNYVIIRHDNGLETVYGHMSKHLVKENQSVRAGQPIGLGGNTGRSTGSHLHFETRFLGEYINPELLFDFGARDVKGDYYVYRNTGGSSVTGNRHQAEYAPVVASNNRKESKKEVAKVESTPSTSKADKAAADKKKADENAKAEKAAADKKKADEKAKAEKAKADKAKADKKAANDKKVAQAKKEEKAKKGTHSVKSGETLYGIAKKYGTTVEKLCKTNHISSEAVLKPGQVLKCS